MMYRGAQLVWYKNNWYHPNFFTRGHLCIKRAKYTCQHCKVPRGGWYIKRDGTFADTGAVIQACHVYRDDTWNPQAKLIALCKQCHLVYDAPMHGEKGSRTKKRNAREKERAVQQDIPLKFRKEKKNMPWHGHEFKIIDKVWEMQTIERLALTPRKYQDIGLIAQQETLL